MKIKTMNVMLGITASVALSTSAFAGGHATGDAAAGEEAFGQCVTCHVVQNEDGETIAGRNAKTGPNLYGVVGRAAGSVEGFRYGKSMVEAGEAGLVWDEASFVAYVQDPNGFLREFLDSRRARGKMAYQVRGADAEAESANIYAYLASVGPEVEMMDKDGDEGMEESTDS
ncbi:c-type cytochrome [Shimia ponticola]|uniref:c-type cytochrome n=1 Tax=Shimia ponticola TaxID=2582893 RepID=UPI00210728A7|nr:cytochrome C [Shimia ponticola]